MYKRQLLGTLVALLVGIGLFLLEYFINNSVNVGFIAVGMTASGVQSLYEGLKAVSYTHLSVPLLRPL